MFVVDGAAPIAGTKDIGVDPALPTTLINFQPVNGSIEIPATFVSTNIPFRESFIITSLAKILLLFVTSTT